MTRWERVQGWGLRIGLAFPDQDWDNLEECLQELAFLSLESCFKVKSTMKLCLPAVLLC